MISAIVLHYLEMIKSQLEHKVLYQLLQMLILNSQQLLAIIKQFAKQIRKRLISQLYNSISRVLQKLLRYFNGTIRSTSFMPSFLV